MGRAGTPNQFPLKSPEDLKLGPPRPQIKEPARPGKFDQPGVGGQPEGGASRGEDPEKAREPRGSGNHPRQGIGGHRGPAPDGSEDSRFRTAPGGSGPAPSPAPPQAGRGEGRRAESPRGCAWTARACANPRSALVSNPRSPQPGWHAFLPPLSPGTRLRHKEWRPARTITAAPLASARSAGRAGRREGTEGAGFEDRLVLVIQSEPSGVRRGGAREEGGGGAEGRGARRLRDERAGSRRLKAANQSAPASFGERRGASPPPPRAPGAG